MIPIANYTKFAYYRIMELTGLNSSCDGILALIVPFIHLSFLINIHPYWMHFMSFNHLRPTNDLDL
jgi:hypothetical protein